MKKTFLFLTAAVFGLLFCGCQSTYPDKVDGYFQLIKDQPIELYSDISGYDYVPMQDGKQYILERYRRDVQAPITFESAGKKFTAWVMINHRWYRERKEAQRFVSTLLIFHGDQLIYKKMIFETLYGVPHSVMLQMPQAGVFAADIAPAPANRGVTEDLKYLSNFPRQTFHGINALQAAQKSDREFYLSLPQIDEYTASLEKKDADRFFAELKTDNALVFGFENVNYLLIPFTSCGTGKFLLLYKGKNLIRCRLIPERAAMEEVKVENNQLTLFYRIDKSPIHRRQLLDFNTLRFDYVSKYPGLYLPDDDRQ